MHSKNEVMINKASKLRPGPLALYVLFCKSVKDERVLKREEIFVIYKDYVAEGESDQFIYVGDGTRNGAWKSSSLE